MSKIRLTGAWLVAGLVLAGCGGTDDADEASAPDTTPPATETTEVTSEPVPSDGCEGGATSAAPGVETEGTLTLDGIERRYLLTTPTAHDGDTPLPLVFDFHGMMEGADIHAQMSQYSTLAEEEEFVVVFPHGTGDPIGWDFRVASEPNADLEYFDTLLEEVVGERCIDVSRVYVTGLSMGAMFTTTLLCERAEVFAAAAPVAGLQDLDGCEPTRRVPIVAFHGTEDPILLFNGGVDIGGIPGVGSDAVPTEARPPADLDGEGYPATVAAWAERNGCDAEPTDTEISSEVVHRVYDCPDGADVEFYIVVGGGHSWPSSEFSRSIAQIVGYTTFDVDGTHDAWEFMSRFSLS